jgi:hypothetical protein
VLQASLNTAVHAMNMYAAIAGAEQSIVRPKYLAVMKLRCDGNLRKLRRRVAPIDREALPEYERHGPDRRRPVVAALRT